MFLKHTYETIQILKKNDSNFNKIRLCFRCWKCWRYSRWTEWNAFWSLKQERRGCHNILGGCHNILGGCWGQTQRALCAKVRNCLPWLIFWWLIVYLGLYIDRVRLKHNLLKTFQVIIPFIHFSLKNYMWKFFIIWCVLHYHHTVVTSK